MRTISIPKSKLIKYIPSKLDGGVIPGAVTSVSCPHLVRVNNYEFNLNYIAHSKQSAVNASCRLDEELEFVNESNRLHNFTTPVPRCSPSILFDDGVEFDFEMGAKSAKWIKSRCVIPDPFDALGKHKLSSFVRNGLSHIACCAHGFNIRLAVIKKDANLISSPVIELKESITFGSPCQHNVGWLIPWAFKSQDVNIAWLDDAEMDQLVSEAKPLPSV